MARPVDAHALVQDLQALPSGPLDGDGLQRLGARVRRAVAQGVLESAVRIHIVSSFMVEMLADAFAASMARRGVIPAIEVAPYAALPTALMGENGFGRGDLVVILPTHRDLLHLPMALFDEHAANAAADVEASFWSGLWARIRAPVIHLGFDPPPFRPLSETDGFMPGGTLRHLRETNQRLARLAPANVAFIDAEALAGRVGPDWHDARTYALCKQPFATPATAEIAETLAASAAALLGRSRKVLVLDLDNTIWGGVVGDVGLENLMLGVENAEGEAFVAVQRYAHALAQRGVILAVCSKNEEDVARSVFTNHSAMVLSVDDIACFVANFEDKATNLGRIARALNVGLESLVFVDDNPIERAWVKEQLPEVMVIDLPPDPAGYVQAIEAAKPFVAHRMTAEDLGRNRSYRSRAIAAEERAAAPDVDAFLAGLQPLAVVTTLTAENEDRVTQLIAKTNQFKLNTSAYSPEDLRSGEVQVMAVSLSDRLQAYGLVGIAVFEPRGRDLYILQWVMSCRVFSRRLEHLMLELLSKHALAAGCDRILLSFLHTGRNEVARRALEALGFTAQGADMLEITLTGARNLDSHHIQFHDQRNGDDRRGNLEDAHVHIPQDVR